MKTISMIPSDSLNTPTLSPALRTLSSRMGVAAVLKHEKSTANLSSLTLDEYRAALRSLSSDILNRTCFDTFLGQFLGEKGPLTDLPPVIDMADVTDGNYLLAILPTDLNGEPWSDLQVQAGAQFYWDQIDQNSYFTLSGDRYPLLLPANIREAGKFSFNASSSADRARQFVTLLEQAYTQILAEIATTGPSK